MNERIAELLAKLDIDLYTDKGVMMTKILVSPKDLRQFAELIVRECVDCLKPLSRNHSMVGAAQDTIKEHFGVEE